MLKYLRMGSKRTKAIWWALTIVTVGTFVGGFIFLFGAGFDRGMQAEMSGALGTVDGEPIARADYQEAVTEQRQAYQKNYKSDPSEDDSRMLEAQAWRQLIVQLMMDRTARRLGLTATDPEVVLGMKTSPPPILLSAPDFQTDGKFDPNKYTAALRNPGFNWAPFERMVRTQLPVRKLQARLLASLKLSQPELLQSYQEQFEKIVVTGVQVPPSTETNVPPPSAADLDRAYETYKGRFSGPARLQLEVLEVPKKYTDEEVRAAREQAKSLVERARRGEDFAALARDYSEGAGAERGGEVNRLLQPNDFGPQLAPTMAAIPKGSIGDPIAEPGRFTIIKVLDRIQDPVSPVPNLRIAQIMIRVHPSDLSLRDQLDQARKIRAQAVREGLGHVAAAKGLSTGRTQFFAIGQTPPQLLQAPAAADWGVSAKLHEVSPVFEGADGYFVAQVSERRPAGPPTKADMAEQLRPLAEAETRLAAARPRAEGVAKAVAAGKTLEQAAAAAGLTTFHIDLMTRKQPDPRLASSPEAVGALFATPLGRVVGPVNMPTGWLIARIDNRVPADTSAFQQLKGQVSSDILERKQREFFSAWLAEQRAKVKVKDLRTP